MTTESGPGPTDQGSTLPLLLAGLLLLALFNLSLVGAAQFLQQQREVNGYTDAIALDLTNQISESRTPEGAFTIGLQKLAESDLRDFYGIGEVGQIQATLQGTQSVQVYYCEASRVTIGAAIWGGNAQVCAVSRAQAR